MLLLLVTGCATVHVHAATAADLAGGTYNSLAPGGSTSSKRHAVEHGSVARVLVQEPAIGDDDEFDWSEDTKPSAPATASRLNQPSEAPAKKPGAQDEAADAAAAAAAAADKPPAKLESDSQPTEAVAKQPQVPDNPKQEPGKPTAKLPDADRVPRQQPTASTRSNDQHTAAADGATDEVTADDAAAPADAAPAADTAAAGAGGNEQEQLEADAAAAARDADSEMDEPDEPMQDGTPALLGDPKAAAEVQAGPIKQQQRQQVQQQQQQQGKQQDDAGTWVAAAGQAAARHDDVDPAGAQQFPAPVCTWGPV
jgi:hypothetical protein